MKIKTNLRAGKGGTGGGHSTGGNGGADNAPGAENPAPPPVIVPVVRCPGY